MKYILSKIGSLIIVLFITSIVVFLIIHMIPGSPADVMTAGSNLSASQTQELLESLELDKPLYQQYFHWIGNALEGDFGKSLYSNKDVMQLIMPKFLNTLKLALFSIILAVGIGIPLGIISAMKQNTVIDIFVMMLAIVGISLPIFWIGLILVMQFSVKWGWLPATGSYSFSCYILPAITISLNIMAVITRMTRSSMLEVLKQDYIRTAQAKGMSKSSIILKHTLKNAMIPIITVIGNQFGYLIGGAVLTETVFVFQGIGAFLVESINRRDYPSVQASMLLITMVFIIVNTLVDIAYHYADPRVKA